MTNLPERAWTVVPAGSGWLPSRKTAVIRSPWMRMVVPRRAGAPVPSQSVTPVKATYPVSALWGAHQDWAESEAAGERQAAAATKRTTNHEGLQGCRTAPVG